jgi:hypothetical protein
MNAIVSIAVQFIPMLVVELLLARRDGYAKKNILKYVGPALRRRYRLPLPEMRCGPWESRRLGMPGVRKPLPVRRQS